MNFRHCRGQEATEFVLITILVFFGALFVVMIFGGKISQFLTAQSSAVAVAKKPSHTITNTPDKYNEGIESYAGPTQNPATQDTTITLGGQQVTQRSDGSLSFVASGQNVTISADMANMANSVFQTTGSNGAEDLVKEVSYMIQQYQSEYAGSDVPVNIMFGDGRRVCNASNPAIYEGSATSLANSFTVQVGNHVVMIQNDQSDNGGSYAGEYRIEGDITNNNTFIGNVTTSNTPSNPTGTFTSTVDTSNGLNFVNANYSQSSDDNASFTYTWNLNFANNQSSLTG